MIRSCNLWWINGLRTASFEVVDPLELAVDVRCRSSESAYSILLLSKPVCLCQLRVTSAVRRKAQTSLFDFLEAGRHLLTSIHPLGLFCLELRVLTPRNLHHAL